jgi:hypothetical protein
MKHLKTYKNFNSHHHYDRRNFMIIFNSLYESHLSVNEKMIIENEFGLINESWFSDLVDKAKDGILKVKNNAQEILSDLAKKAKDILDFAKQLAGKIGDYVKEQFSSLKDKVKNYATKDAGFAGIIFEFLEKKKDSKLKNYLNITTDLIKYILSGKMITDLIDRLSECFSKLLKMGTNEGIQNIEYEFLRESDEGEEKKSFLQRLGEKLMSLPPFSWIPKIEEIMKKGITSIGKLVDRFFASITTGKDSIVGSKFSKSFIFLFQILELYVHYKIVGKIEKYKEMLMKANGLEEIGNQIKDQSFDQLWNTIGINGEEVVSNVKKAVMKIPYVGRILSILDTLVLSVGIYLAIEPTLKKLN